ncbi:MAG: hypothetical protein H6842_08195 [Rhodospirillaceae bacterium]|nr:hypothetical protein [Rhodospirillaceae bacterium]
MIRSLCIGLALVLVVAACQTDRSSVASRAGTTTARTGTSVAAQSANAMFPDLPQAIQPLPQGACLSDDEIRADQFILLKTQMMLVGLTCNGAYSDPNVFGHYQDFISTHAGTIRSAQQTMASLLARYRGGNPNRLFDTYATSYSNNESQVMNQVSAGRYCQLIRDRFYRASGFSAAEMQSFLGQAVQQNRAHYQSCG